MMKGWKTWFAVAVSAITGIYRIVVEGDLHGGITMIVAAIGLVGIGHKIEKTTVGG